MTISYNWLCEYLPVHEIARKSAVDPEKISQVLTSIGLEVESLERKESVKGGLKGLIAGEVLSCEKHPNADKLKVTTVSVGQGNPLQIVCGAANVRTGQKVIIAPVDTNIYPINSDMITIKNAKIRGVESEGMICAEDEIGLGTDHSGIMVLPAGTKPGTPVAEIFLPYTDHVFEIGLTPNRIDAMSHIGVAKDICAYFSHHHKTDYSVILPFENNFKTDLAGKSIDVQIESTEGCKRYSGISIHGIRVTDSPLWLKQRLTGIGIKSINNIVDITNYILHETGQPLHAFDADKIKGNTIIVKKAATGDVFKTLDDKERKLTGDDLVISNEYEAMCIAGIYGGAESGVTQNTVNIFIESAWFDPATIRRTSMRFGLRTDAAARFEKGTDISNTLNVLKRAALLIKEIAGGSITGDIIDVYPDPAQKSTVSLSYHYLKKLSGKNYHGDAIKNILKNLSFEIVKDGADEIVVNVPFSKPDVTIPADIVEEILRIDGLDNIDIPGTISIAPAIEMNAEKFALKEKIAGYLTASGCYEIFTNSITNSRFFDESTLDTAVKMINSLSSELDIMRPSMLQTGLQAIAYNINRKNNDLHFFEFGRTYEKKNNGYLEKKHLSLYVSGFKEQPDWKHKEKKTDVYHLKGLIEKLFALAGIRDVQYVPALNKQLKACLEIYINKTFAGILGEVAGHELNKHDIKQPVYYADLLWDDMLTLRMVNETYKEISRFPGAQRDLAIVLDKNIPFAAIQKTTADAGIEHLISVQLFDVFESEKLGAGKKSMALNYFFSDEKRTLTDKDIDSMMNKLITSYEKELTAEIRK